MPLLWSLLIFCSIISVSITDNGNCGTGQQAENSNCCANFHRDPRTKQCLPCIGSFGLNCSSPCPDGYYGSACRQICNCNETQKCNQTIGCIYKGDHNVEESSTPSFAMETKHIFLVVSSFCLLVLFAGYVFYCVRRRRLQSGQHELMYSEVKDVHINESTIATPCKECTSNHSQVQGTIRA
uniref:Protein draper-like n=1 Tax=Crassostrea virginica TaxID=6565 RepID=A0A8B8DGD6_CRAVI|nr:protein draper-like [Crassostrea virginica]